MVVSRRGFLSLLGSLMGGWFIAMPKPYSIEAMARILVEMSDFNEQRDFVGAEDTEKQASGAYRLLDEIGYFNDISPKAFVFDENKYSASKRQLESSEWDTNNRHLPIKIAPSVINKPGERSPQALKGVIEYTQFYSPRYVAAPGERVTMCNIAAWDWSRAMRVHLPHWIGETEMSANMLFRWISHPQAGGIYGEGWQPVNASAVQLLASGGIPVFALVENSVPGKHGHVALVYPENQAFRANQNDVGPYFATVNNGRSRGGNGIKNLRTTFRWLKPTYFVHNNDFIVYRDS